MIQADRKEKKNSVTLKLKGSEDGKTNINDKRTNREELNKKPEGKPEDSLQKEYYSR